MNINYISGLLRHSSS